MDLCKVIGLPLSTLVAKLAEGALRFVSGIGDPYCTREKGLGAVAIGRAITRPANLVVAEAFRAFRH